VVRSSRLATEGIERGHMSLDARNVAVAAGATPDDLPEVVARLVADRAVRVGNAERILEEKRAEGGGACLWR
jgi:hydroxymethylglutaryl-CoA reductase